MPDYMQTGGLDNVDKLPPSTSLRPKFANRLYLPVDKGTQLVLLDEDAVNIYEHGVFIQGDKGSMKMKVTCVSPGADPVPDKCRICNAMIKDERIVRKYVAYLSCIDLAVFNIEGRTITHTRKMVPLNHQAAKMLKRRRESFGSLRFAMFKVYRNQKTSPQVGDDWTFMKKVDPRGFQNSPRIKMLIESFGKQGKTISPKEAWQMLIAPFNYAEELEPTKQKVDYFLGYLGIGDGVAAQPDSGNFNYADDTLMGAPASGETDFGDSDFATFDEPEPPKLPAGKKKVVKKKGTGGVLY